MVRPLSLGRGLGCGGELNMAQKADPVSLEEALRSILYEQP